MDKRTVTEEKKKIRSILHLDMDAFYPAVEVLDDPGLKRKPVIVGGSKKRGVVSSASYEARRYGIHSAQPMARAIRLCPEAVVLPVRMARYKEISDRIFKIFERFTPLVEPLSIDEAFLDVTGTERLFGDPVHVAALIKKTIKEEIGLTVSAGIAPSKFVAKIASDMEKPDGLTVVSPDKVREFLDPLPIQKMWGVGKVTQEALTRMRIKTFYDLRGTPVEILEDRFGEYGLKMHRLAMGQDEREVETAHEMKSIGHEQTFLEDILSKGSAKKELLSLAMRVGRRMRKTGVRGKTISLKVKYNDFVQITRAATLPKPTDDGADIYTMACRLLEKTEVGQRPVRLLGISLSQLEFFHSGDQLSLFHEEKISQKRRDLNAALDRLQERYGEKSVGPGSLFSE
jgi:DNA polymerase-4